jgi:hypothetical protein
MLRSQISSTGYTLLSLTINGLDHPPSMAKDILGCQMRKALLGVASVQAQLQEDHCGVCHKALGGPSNKKFNGPSAWYLCKIRKDKSHHHGRARGR